MDTIQPHRELPHEVAGRIRAARERRGWTRAVAAERIGLSLSYLAHLEGGRRVPSRAVADDLIRALMLDDLDPAAAEQLRELAVPDRGRSGPHYRPKPEPRYALGGPPGHAGELRTATLAVPSLAALRAPAVRRALAELEATGW